MLPLSIKIKIRKRRAACKATILLILGVQFTMADEIFDDVDDWPIAKRKRVELSLLDDSIADVTQYKKTALKRWRSAQIDELQAIPSTVKRSGGNAKREVAQAKIQEEKERIQQEVWQAWEDNDLKKEPFACRRCP
jgi:hypothetical protein